VAIANKSYISGSVRNFSCSQASPKGIYPESDNPPAKTLEPEAKPQEPTELTIEEYHEVADTCIDRLVATFEELQEAREDVDVEYSVSFCSTTVPRHCSNINPRLAF
jgi:frataxin